jgi:phosphate transport system substrate-binding protein
MVNKNSKRIRLNKESVLLLKGLIVGKVLTLIVIGGLVWWLWPRKVNNDFYASDRQNFDNKSSATSNFQSVINVPTGSFSYSGSYAWAPIRLLVDSQIQNARRELQLRYVNSANSSSDSSLQMLLDGRLDFAQLSRPLTQEEYATAQQQGIKLKQHSVALDGIAVVVNPSLQIPGLTVNQLQQIYQGKIINWSQVGGPNLPITALSLPSDEKDLLLLSAPNEQKKLKFGSGVQYINTTTEALRKVSKTPGSIYYGSAGITIPQCSVKPLPLGHTSDRLIPPYQEPLVPSEQCPNQRNQVNAEAFRNGSYPLLVNLSVVTKQSNSQQQNVGEAYTKLVLTDIGQKAIAQAGFISLNKEALSQARQETLMDKNISESKTVN